MYSSEVRHPFHAAWRLGDERLTGSTFTVTWHLTTYTLQLPTPGGELAHWLDEQLDDSVLLAPGDPLGEVLADDARVVTVEASTPLLARYIYDETIRLASTPTLWLAAVTVEGPHATTTYRPGPTPTPPIGACCNSPGGEQE